MHKWSICGDDITQVAQAKCLGFGNLRIEYLPDFVCSRGIIYTYISAVEGVYWKQPPTRHRINKKLPPGVWLIECINIVNGIQMRLSRKEKTKKSVQERKSLFGFIDHIYLVP